MDTKAFRTKLLIEKLSKIYPDNFSQSLIDITSAEYQKILIIAPHADDEVIGCGAAIEHFARKGAHITVLIVTQESSRSIAKSYDYVPQQRVEESYEAQSVLGYDELIYFNFPELMLRRDGHLQKCFCLELVELILKYQPDSIFIPNKAEMHPDHQIIGKLAEEVISEGLNNRSFQQLEATVVYEIWGPVMMNSFLEITDTAYTKKITGIQCYKSQLSSVDYEKIIEFIGVSRGKDLMNVRSHESDPKFTIAEGYRLFNYKEN
ncbi:PIG-L deacetylase family protein [Chryseobacterium sp. T1]